MKKKSNFAQTLLEYSILISVAAAALIGMRVYLTRAVQEKYRQAAEVYGQGEQYAKGITKNSNLDSGLKSDDVFISCEGAIKHVVDLNTQVGVLKNRVDNLNQLLNDALGKNLQLEVEKAESEKEVQRLRDSATNMEAQAKQNRLDADGLGQRAL